MGRNRRYFARVPDLSGGLHQLFLRNSFGGAVGFAVGIVGGADPDRPRGGSFTAVMLAAEAAGDESREGGWLLRLGRRMLPLSAQDLRLDRIECFL